MFNVFKKGKKKRVAILGIDGVPCSLLKDFIRKGIMPNLSSIVTDASLREMDASIPEVSSTSWTTFMTGVNPGKHNIYGFMELKPNSYSYYFPNSGDIKSDTIWDIIGKHDKKSVVINLPSTYPARPLNGVLTAGFVALDLQKATYPQAAYDYLKGIGYKMDVDAQKARTSMEALAEDIDLTFQKRAEALLHFYDKHPWDLYIGIVTETDRLHHFLWSALEDNAHPLHGYFIEFYRKIDGLIGQIADRCGSEVPFLIVSDHGFAKIKHEIYLNTWLIENGYLKFKKETPESFEDIHPDSIAFALDPSRIYINTKQRYPSGCVEESNYENIRMKLRGEMEQITVDGVRVMKHIYLKEELYHGPHVKAAPDLVALANTGYDLKGALNKKTVSGSSIFSGAHTQNNATFFINRTIPEGRINIMDIAPTVLKLIDITYDNFDGKAVL